MCDWPVLQDPVHENVTCSRLDGTPDTLDRVLHQSDSLQPCMGGGGGSEWKAWGEEGMKVIRKEGVSGRHGEGR